LKVDNLKRVMAKRAKRANGASKLITPISLISPNPSFGKGGA
jgi:hypothetical protein